MDIIPGNVSSVPRARVTGIAGALDFYLALGCEVRLATDGWALLGCGGTSFVLTELTGPDFEGEPPEDPTTAQLPWVRLSTPDVRALRRRLLGDGVPTSAVLRTAHRSIGEIHVVDPDRRTVVIEQAGPGVRRGHRGLR